MPPPLVSVTIVTYNSRKFIAGCLESVFAQSHRPLEVIVVDNASSDGTLEALAPLLGRIRLLRNRDNRGFAAAQNRAIGASGGEWVLVLNPDAKLMPDFVERLLEVAQLDARVGTACGKLLSIGPDFQPPAEPRLDSAGLYFTPSLRHFDRGCGELENGRYGATEYVFGASAAVALYRRRMIEDVSLEDGFFDPDFFAYREDADVAWRAQLLGWRCIYTPHAVGYHVRSVWAGNRRSAPPILRMHSVKNRFLMRVKNATGGLYRRHWASMTARDLMVAGGCLLLEPRSLEAFWRLARCLPRALAKRRHIMARRRVCDAYLAAWFSPEPAARPVEEFVPG